jgi:hypothetical protein
MLVNLDTMREYSILNLNDTIILNDMKSLLSISFITSCMLLHGIIY